MTLFVDASALVAMIAGEPQGDDFLKQVQDDRDPLCSAITCWEATTALCRSYGFAVADARRAVADTVAARPLRMVSIGSAEADLALDAYQAYGKGRHPARLNMGDCFAYACARANGARLLYKGDDFAQTDLA